MLKKYASYLYSGGGVAAAFFILVLANFVLGTFSTRVDLTQGGLYTLSEGTRIALPSAAIWWGIFCSFNFLTISPASSWVRLANSGR